jgi:recombination protein RecT
MSKEATSSTRDLMIQGFHSNLAKITPHLEKLLPFKGAVEKFCEMAYLAIVRDLKLLDCDLNSLLRALIWCASKNMEPGVDDGVWLIPFKGIVTPVPAYKGLIKKAVETESIKDVQPFPVFANDTFEYGLGLTPYIDHKPPKLGAPRGDLIGVYVIITMPDMTKRFWVMDRADVEAIRNSSAAYKAKPNEGPWHDWFEKMAMKTVIKQGLKYIPMKPPLRDLLYDDNKLEAGETVTTLLQTSGVELGDLGGDEGPGVPAPEPDTSAFDDLVAGKNLGAVQKKHLEIFLKETAASQKKVKLTVEQLKAKAATTVSLDGKSLPTFVVKTDGTTIWDAFLVWEAGRFPKPKEEKKEPPATTVGAETEQHPHEDKVVTPEVVEEDSGDGEGEGEWGTPSKTFEQEQGDTWNIVIQKGIPLRDLMKNTKTEDPKFEGVKNMADITPERLAQVKAFVISWEPPQKGKK